MKIIVEKEASPDSPVVTFRTWEPASPAFAETHTKIITHPEFGTIGDVCSRVPLLGMRSLSFDEHYQTGQAIAHAAIMTAFSEARFGRWTGASVEAILFDQQSEWKVIELEVSE